MNINDLFQLEIEAAITRYHQMSDIEKAQYRRQLKRDIEAANQASAEIHTEKLVLRLRGLDD